MSLSPFRALSVVSVLAFATGCADAEPTEASVEEPLDTVEPTTLSIDKELDQDVIDKNFSKTIAESFSGAGLTVTSTATAKVHFDFKDPRIVGSVTYGRGKRHGGFTLLRAELAASGHYDASAEIDLDVKGEGDWSKMADNQTAWAAHSLGGRPFAIVKSMMSTTIPIAGPLFVHAHVELSASCALHLHGDVQARAAVGVAGEVDLSAKYDRSGFVDAKTGKSSYFQFAAGAPNFHLSPAPKFEITAAEGSLKGRCALQPTIVILVENAVGGKLVIEPYIDVAATAAPSDTGDTTWAASGQAGIEGHGTTRVEVFGYQLFTPREFALFDVKLQKDAGL